MASTITATTLTVTISENVTINGSQQGGSNILTIGSVNEVFKRILTCPASVTTKILTYNAAVSGFAGAVQIDKVKYVRVTNLDDTNAIELAVVGAATLYQVTLAAGESHILGSPEAAMLAEADVSPSFGTMADLASLQVNPAGNAVDVELFVASI